MSEKSVAVAIDGPVASGKSTVAKEVAEKMGFLYLDTGAMYRAVSWMALKNNISPGNAPEVVVLAQASRMDIEISEGSELGYKVFMDGEDVTPYLHTTEVSGIVSPVSEIPGVRSILVEKQRLMARNTSVVMAGRDIGTVVLPFAAVKIFLTASVAERARRRFKELREKGVPVSLEEVVRNVQERDRIDSTRAASPLKPAEDSIMLDSTGMDADAVVDRIVSIIKEKTGTL
ncbi:MAG: (d)CMP kinase [Chloroflexi bacterium]|nr:(d)CMP kinase [Chloroflexota bacterium]